MNELMYIKYYRIFLIFPKSMRMKLLIYAYFFFKKIAMTYLDLDHGTHHNMRRGLILALRI